MTKEHHLRTAKRGRGNSVGNISVSGGGIGIDGDQESDSDNDIHNENEDDDDMSAMTAANYNEREEIGVLGHQSKFLTTSMMLRLFSAGVKHPEDGMKVVYVDGAWDMFHCGHVEFLREASKVSALLVASSANKYSHIVDIKR